MKRLIILLSLLISSVAAAGDKLVVLDVGEGLAVLLKHELQGILIDTGRPGMSTRILKRLEAHGVKSLSFIILTHLHIDHAGEICFRLTPRFTLETP